MLTVMLAAAALLADATPAATKAPVAPTPAATAVAPAKKAGDVFCRKEAVLGTNIPKRVCYSRAEYEANKAESRQTLEHIQASTPALFAR
jgi:hypothetical protein